MNAPVRALSSETAQIEAALDVLLRAAVAADRERPLRPERGLISAGDLAFAVIDRMKTWTPAQQAAAELLQRPVWEAVRQAVSTLGVRLHEIGGLPLMQDVCHRVAALDPDHEGRRLDIMDKRWDGIGADGANAGWLA